jgi:hypothetical protein
MCTSTRFPEAIPLRNIKAGTIVKALTKFFTFVGLPKYVQSDQGSNFTSGLFQQVMSQMGIEQRLSSAYHPQSQGVLERYHQTVKSMMRAYCEEFQCDWDEGIHLLLFATRESVQETLGFSPFELVFGHTVRGPLKLLKEKWLSEQDPQVNLLEYVSTFKNRLHRALEIARSNLKEGQAVMKTWYDKSAQDRQFQVGDKVLVLFPILGSPLQAKYHGPYEVKRKVNDLNYIVTTPDRRKNHQLCHINMLKGYHTRSETVDTPPSVITEETPTSVSAVTPAQNCEQKHDGNVSPNCDNAMAQDEGGEIDEMYPIKLENSDILENLDTKLSHLDADQKQDIEDLVHQFECIFPDVPNKTTIIEHDVDVGDHAPIKQHPYRINPAKADVLKQEIEYMLRHDIIEPCHSPWSSPCILVPKPDGSARFVTDFRKVNLCSKTDTYPIPRIEDCIDKIGNSKFVSKFDLLKGYWGVPLSEQARDISAFCTPFGLYRYKVMPFGLKNAPATFQRMINQIVTDIPGCEAYIDDVIIYSETWDEHVERIRLLFQKLAYANLTVNLVKSEFGQTTVLYLGHVVGQGQVRPYQAKVEAIERFPPPSRKKELMRFLGMAGFYRKFCPNFSDVAEPLTNLLKKDQKFIWSDKCQQAFEKIKGLLMSSPILVAPNFEKAFKIQIDASDVGCGGVLLQENEQGIDQPVCFYSRKFNKHQRNYSTIEKETLALILSLKQFEVYVSSPAFPVVVYSDHNPLTYVLKMRKISRKLMRWSLIIQEYPIEIRHIKGKENVIADTLSRVEI